MLILFSQLDVHMFKNTVPNHKTKNIPVKNLANVRTKICPQTTSGTITEQRYILEIVNI